MDFNDSFSVEMSPKTFASVNVPVSVFSIIFNMVFVFCMVFSHNGTNRLKPPLTVLLGLLVGCNIAAHVCILVKVFDNFFPSFSVWRWVTSAVIYTMMISVNSSHWQNVFYCLQIIPVQHPYFIWLKRNIRILIYSALIINAVVCLLGMSVNIAEIELFNRYDETTDHTDWKNLGNAEEAGIWMTLCLFCLSLCVMLISSCATVFFLWRHLKNMENSDGNSSCRQRHIRTTIISIAVQAVLHVICSAFVIIDELICYVSPWYFDLEYNILCTVVSLYCFGTTINMAISQSLFRQRAVHVWQKLFQPHSSLSVSAVTHTVSTDVLSN